MKREDVLKSALAGNVLLLIKSPDNTGYTQENNVYLYPTFLVLNSDGEPLYTWIGWPGAEKWAEQFMSATRDDITIADRKARFGTQPTFADAYMLGTIEYARRNTRAGHDYYREAIRLDEAAARRKGVPALLFKTAYRGVGNGDVSLEECMAVTEEVLSDERVRTEDALEITERLARVVNDVGEESLIPFFEMAYPVIDRDTSEELESRRQGFYANYAIIVEKNPAKAVELKKGVMPKGWKDDPGQLNSFAWWCFEKKVNIEEAEELSRRSAELAEDPGLKANCLDTLAELVNLRGDTAGALELIKRGLEIDPENEYLERQQARFEEALALTS